MNRFIALFVSIIVLCTHKVFALTVEVGSIADRKPFVWQTNQLGNIQASGESYVKLIDIANEYLRFALAAVCMWVLIYIGIKLMTAQWDKTKMQQANRALVGMIIGLVIAYFSYTLIRMVANWF